MLMSLFSLQMEKPALTRTIGQPGRPASKQPATLLRVNIEQFRHLIILDIDEQHPTTRDGQLGHSKI
jgi:hypothetical protein